MGENYLIEGTKLRCNRGSLIKKLMLPASHGCYDPTDNALINIKSSNFQGYLHLCDGGC